MCIRDSAFAAEPDVLFADEPTGNLDSHTGERISDLLFQLNQERGTTLVLVTHDERLAHRCQRLIRLEEMCIRDRGKAHLQCAKEMTVLDQKQRGQVKDLVTRHQTGVVPGIDPAPVSYTHLDVYRRQPWPAPPAAGTCSWRSRPRGNLSLIHI